MIVVLISNTFTNFFNTLTFNSAFNAHKNIFYFRALNINSLVGNIGGYVGLLMGVSISQLPYFILQAHDYLKNVMNRLSKIEE